MTPDFIPLLAASVLSIGTLALFAGHNRKTGWTKQRGKASQFYSDYYEGAHTENTMTQSTFRESNQPSIPILPLLEDGHAYGFSQQLLNLRAALGTAGMAPATVEEQHPVLVTASK